MEKRLTSSDIAEKAGVSQTAVSLVIRNKWQGRVGKETVKRIQRTIEENDYHPNHAASLLKSGRSRNIALIVPDSENPFFSRILHSLRQQSIPRGYECMLVETASSKTWYDYIEDSILGGEISYAVNLYNEDIETNPQVRKKMITVGDRENPSATIQIDYSWAVEKAVSLLISSGYNNLVYVVPDREKTRISAFRESLQTSIGTTLSPSGHIENNVYELLQENSEKIVPHTGLILDDDLYACGAYRYLEEKGLKIRKDAGIISMNDTFVASWLNPALSSFGCPIESLVSIILSIVEKNKDVDGEKHTILMNINSNRSY